MTDLERINKVIDDLFDIMDTARSNFGEEGYQSLKVASYAVQKAWNICKKGQEEKLNGAYKTPVNNSRKPIKSSLYISDVIDDISDDCFNEIYQQISKKYPNLDDEELTEKIDKYITDWKYDSDSIANTKAQAKKIVIDNWDQYIDLSNVSVMDNDEAGFSTDNRLDKDEQDFINQLVNKYQNGISSQVSHEISEYADKKFPFSKDENKHKQYCKKLEEAYYLNPVVIDKYSDYCVRTMIDAFKGGMFPTTIDGVYDWMKWWGTPLSTRKSSKYAECILKKLKETMGNKIIKSSLEDRLLNLLEEFEEGYADTINRDVQEGSNGAYEEAFIEGFKNDYNLTNEDIEKLRESVHEIWNASSEEGEVRDMGEMYGVPRGASSEEALKHFE